MESEISFAGGERLKFTDEAEVYVAAHVAEKMAQETGYSLNRSFDDKDDQDRYKR